MIKHMKRLALAYFAFGMGVLLGVTIASVVSAFMMLTTLDPEHLERISAFSEDTEKE